MGGHLVTAPSADAPGLANYLVKRDWRRVDDCEIRAEGHNYFRPNTSIPLGRQPLFADGEITLTHEVKRPNKQKCVIVGTQSTLYRYFSQVGGGYFASDYYDPADYFNDNPGEWLVIGTGFSSSGNRWQAVDVNGYVILNNGVDLPVVYRVEWSAVVPLYELRELGVASVGVIFELESYLCAANVRQIQEPTNSTANTQAIMGMISSGSVTGSQSGAVSSADARVVGAIAASTNVINTTGDIFLSGHVGKSVRFLNQYTATIVEYYGPRSVRVDVGPDADITAMIFVITRPIISGGLGSVLAGSDTVQASPGNQPFLQGPTMAGDYYVYFEPMENYPQGWASAIVSVTNFQEAALAKAAPAPINLASFRVVPAEFIMTLTAGTFQFEDEMSGEYIVTGYKRRKIVCVVDGTHALMDTDYPFASTSLRITNPDAYAPYEGATDGYGYRVIWGLPGKPERFGSNVECSILAGDNQLTLSWPMKSLKTGDPVIVLGAGDTGGNLLSTIKMVIGDTIILKDVAQTPVKKISGVKASTLTHVTTVATFTSVDPHGFINNQLVTISGVVNQDVYNGAFTVTVSSPTVFTYTLLSDPGADATTIDGITAASDPGLLQLQESISDNERFNDLEDDGSAIQAVRKLKGIGVILRETSIFLMGDSGQINPPFTFDLVYGGSKGDDRAGSLAFPFAVSNVKDDYLLYPGENDFYRFDLVTRLPQIFDPLHVCRNLFFDAAERGDDVFVADNEVTREVVFFLPDSPTNDRIIRFDYLFGTVSTGSSRVTAACSVNRPLNDSVDNDEKWFAMALGVLSPAIGIMGYYGRTSAKQIGSGSIVAGQSGTTVTSGSSIFLPEHVGRTIVFANQVSAHITEYVSGTVVTVEPSQTIVSSTFTILPASWQRFGLDYSSEIQSANIDFGISSREKRLRSYSPRLAEKYIGGTVGQKAEINLALLINELIPGQWYQLGRVNVSNIQASAFYTVFVPDPLDPFNLDAASGHPTSSGNSVFQFDLVNGLARVIPGALPAAISGGRLQFIFDCAAIANSFTVELWGAMTVAKGMNQLFSRTMSNLQSGDVIKTSYARYLYQDRLKITGANNSARLSMRAFEIHGVESSQIGRQNVR